MMAANPMPRRRAPAAWTPAGRLLGTLAAAAAILGATPRAQAFAEYEFDLKLLKGLQEIQMLDYAQRQIQQMLAKYPERRDEILVEQARVLFRLEKRGEATAVLARIPATSPFAITARLLEVDNALRTGNLAAAKQALTDYLAKARGNITAANWEEFRRAVIQYATVLKQEGNLAEANRQLDLLTEAAPKEVDPGREVGYMKGQFALDQIAQAVEKGGKADAELLKKAKAQLIKAQLSGGADALTGFTVIELARAEWLAKNYEAVLKTIQDAAPLLKAVDGAVKKADRADMSPVPGVWLYHGRAQMELAKALRAKDAGDAEKRLEEAIQALGRIRERYPSSPYVTDATLEQERARGLMQSLFNRTIGAPAEAGLMGEGAAQGRLREGDQLLKAKKPVEAAAYLAVVREVARRSPSLPQALAGLIESYVAANKTLLAQAAASYLREVSPADDEFVERSLLRLGGLLYNAARDLKDREAREAALAEAMIAWQQFVDYAPKNPRAAEIAFHIAENEYRRGSELAGIAKAMKEGAEKEAVKARARAAYESSIPKYRQVLERFPASDRATRASYKLGWAHYSADQPKPAAAAFLKYVEAETNPKFAKDRMEAKFRAAEQLMAANETEAALRHFHELLDWLKPEALAGHGLEPKSEIVPRLREDATSFLGWTWDRQADAIRPQLEALEGRISQLEEEDRTAAERRTQIQATVATLAADLAKATAEWADRERELTTDTSAAEREKLIEEETRGKTGADLAAARQIAEETARRMVATASKSARDGIAPEKESLRERIEMLRDSRPALERRGQELQAEIKRLGDALALKEPALRTNTSQLETAEQALRQATAAVTAAETAVTRLTADFEKAKAEGGATRAAAARALTQAEARLADARKELERRQMAAEGGHLEKLRTTAAALAAEVAALRTERASVQAEAEVAQLELQLLDAHLDRATNGLKRCDAAAAFLASGSLPDLFAAAPYKAAAAAEVAAGKKELGLLTALADLRRQRLQAEVAVAATAAAARQEALAQLRAQRQPLAKASEAARREAAKALKAYLAAYPQGRYVPESLLRISMILQDFKEYDESSRLLVELGSRHADSRAAKQAFFLMGRSQVETGEPAKAAEAFAKVLATAADQPLYVLDYIAGKMLSVNPRIAAQAAVAALNRRHNPQHPDQAAAARLADRLAVLAAEATLADTANPTRAADALKLLETLLREKPNTGYFFETQFLMAKGWQEQGNLAKTLDAYNAILARSFDNPPLTTRAQLEKATALVRLGGGDPEKTKMAAALYHMVMLGDAANPATRPYLEQAARDSLQLYKRLNDLAGQERIRKRYRELFPNGKPLD
ncbi:MAG: hypothetical protein WC789_10915 [Lentisphaeria bacterium]